MKDFIYSLLIIAIIVSIFLGIWWDAFPFWKAFGTEIFIAILVHIFVSDSKKKGAQENKNPIK
jgi:hypothetical protein